MSSRSKSASESVSELKNALRQPVEASYPGRFTAFFLQALQPLSKDLNKNAGGYLLLLLLAYFFITAANALRLLWYDELNTFYIGQYPSIMAGWSAVKAGADLNPPLLYALVHISQKLFGANELATRLPSIIGMAFVVIALYAVLNRRIGRVFAMCAAMIPLITDAFGYASEARPYALLLAGAALALISWLDAAENESTLLSLAGITGGLGVALLSHCFAVVLAIPFAAGEIVRSLKLHRIDWRVWMAFAASTPALLFYPSLIRSSNGVAGHIFPPSASRLVTVYSDLIGPAWPWLALAFLLLIWLGNDSRSKLSFTPSWESAWLAGVLLIPVVMVAFTMFTGRVFAPRYALVAVLGLAILLGKAFHRAASADERAGSAVLLLFVAVFLGTFLAQLRAAPPKIGLSAAGEHPAAQQIVVKGHALLSQVPDADAPVVIATGLWFFQIDHYAPPQLASRLYYVHDPAAALHYTGSNVFDIGYQSAARWFPIRGHVVPYSEFLSHTDRFFVYCAIKDQQEWLLQKLTADKIPLQQIAYTDEAMLLEVRVPSIQTAPSVSPRQ